MNTSQNSRPYSAAAGIYKLLPLSVRQALPDSFSNAYLEIPQNISVPGGIPGTTDDRIRIKIVVDNTQNTDKRRAAESEFSNSFDQFFKKYCFYQKFILMLFLILIIGATDSDLFALTLLFGLAAAYITSLGMTLCKAETNVEKCYILFKMVESLGAAIFVMWNFIKLNSFNSDSTIEFLAFLLTSYLFKTVIEYCCNYSALVKFTNQVNRTILAVRICTFIQGALLLLQSSKHIQISSYRVYIPFYSMILVIICFTVRLVKSIYFSSYSQFWNNAVDEKKAGLQWIFGNLFGLISILLLQGAILLFDYSQVELLIYFGIVAWCTISLLFSESRRDAVFKVCETLANIFNKEIQPKKTKYVTRISSSDFKPTTEQEINTENNKREFITMPSEGDLEQPVQNSSE